MRWKKANDEIIPSGEFIFLAEECGMMEDLGFRSLDITLRSFAELKKRCPHPIKLTLNFTKSQLASEKLKEALRFFLMINTLHPSEISIDIKEEYFAESRGSRSSSRFLYL